MDNRSIYQAIDEVVTRMKRRGIHLIPYGNWQGRYSVINTEADAATQAWDVENIRRALIEIPLVYMKSSVQPDVYPTDHSYILRHALEQWRSTYVGGDPYISNGDFIVAMLICGYDAHFGTFPYSIGCELNALVISDFIDNYDTFEQRRSHTT